MTARSTILAPPAAARDILPMLPLIFALLQTPAESLKVSGLRAPVEIVRDNSGISHIYARNEHDLFFAQGYSAARDRLFQFEIWRRQATGTVSQLLGRRELERDIGARLFRYRGDMQRELNHYHPHGAAIVGAFVDGVNAYVAATERDPTLLPIEFKLLGTKPGRWTPDVVISRHQGLLGNVENELNFGRAVSAVGPAVVKRSPISIRAILTSHSTRRSTERCSHHRYSRRTPRSTRTFDSSRRTSSRRRAMTPGRFSAWPRSTSR